MEGMYARTHSLLRELYVMRLVPILVLDKIDRLVGELGLAPTEAYLRLRNLIETVNAAAANMLNSNRALRHTQQTTTEPDPQANTSTHVSARPRAPHINALTPPT